MALTWGRPTLWFGRPMSAASRAAFRPGHCLVGPQLVYVSAGALYASFLCQMGLFWMCNAGWNVLYISVVSSVCFHVIPDLCACKPRITKTRGIRY